MKLTSRAFSPGSRIPSTYTTEGQDVSPPLTWTDVPDRTQSFALICDDPDAPSRANPGEEPWVHWVIFNIAPDCRDFSAGISPVAQPDEAAGAVQGQNSWGKDGIGYRGPAPPAGSGEHRYFFKLYALDTKLSLEAGATKQQLLDAMAGHVLATGELMGTYER
jgi:Raf kinase inhibitor-like YbhB/YbcL family protein